MPITATSQVEEVVGDKLDVIRTPASLAALTQAAAGEGVVFAGAPGGGYVFPGFLPAYDASASLCKLLELLAPVDQPLSKLVAALPRPTLIHRQLQCPWALKGTVMRVLNERFADANVDLRDGIKIFDERGWVQVLARRRRAARPSVRRGRDRRRFAGSRDRAAHARHRGDRAGGDRQQELNP